MNPMNPSKTLVSVQSCFEYDSVKVGRAIRRALEQSGNTELIKRGERVFVKINHLSPASSPERGIITHPVVVEEVVKILLDLGAKVTIGDDVEVTGNPYAVSGISGISRRLGVALVNLKGHGFERVAVADGEIIKTVHVARDVLEADAIVSVPKLKTHGLTLITCALKNMFGAIPLGERINFHRDYPDPEVFSAMLVDLYSVIRPRLFIVDGIVAMEGEGPAAGDTRALGALLVGDDAVAVDAVTGLLINLQPYHIPTCRIANDRGLGIGDQTRIEILGDGMKLAISDFSILDSSLELVRKILPAFLYSWLYDHMVRVELLVDAQRCTRCHACVRVCPMGAVLPVGEGMKIDDKNCIQCFCCQEVCRYGAVLPRKKPAAEIIRGVVRIIRRI